MEYEADFDADEEYFYPQLGLNLRDTSFSHFDTQQNSPEASSQQRVSGLGLRSTDNKFGQFVSHHLAPGEILGGEVSKWSSDNSEELEAEVYFREPVEDKLQRHRRFFQGEPLMRCLKEEEARYHSWMDTLLFDNLYHEVQHGLRETRRQDVVRAYWMKAREQLAIDDSEIDLCSDWAIELWSKYTQLSYLGVARNHHGWKRPTRLCSSSGKDLELEETRSLCFDRKRNTGRAATFSKVGEYGDNTVRFLGEDISRAATFG